MWALPMTLNPTAETETAMIARGLRERDMELLADLVERCQHRLVRYLLYLTGKRENAEDLAQETCHDHIRDCDGCKRYVELTARTIRGLREFSFANESDSNVQVREILAHHAVTMRQHN